MVIFYHCGSKYEILDQPCHRKFHSNGWFKTVAMVFSLKRVNMRKSGFCQKFSKYVNYENLSTLLNVVLDWIPFMSFLSWASVDNFFLYGSFCGYGDVSGGYAARKPIYTIDMTCSSCNNSLLFF